MTRDNFELKKLKIDPSTKKVTIIYKKIVEGEGKNYTDEVELVSPRVPHPDMEDAIKALAPHLAEANALYIHRNLRTVAPALRKSMEGKEIERILEVWDGIVNDSVTVSGVSIQGTIKSGSVVITGKREVHNTAVAMNSPKMSFDGDSFGIEAKVQELCKRIIWEAYSYIFENKSAQLDMFTEKEEAAA